MTVQTDPRASDVAIEARPTPKEAILAGAVELGLESGAAAITLRSVAKAVGLSAAAIIYHFGTRDGLLREVFGHVAASLAGFREEVSSQFKVFPLLVGSPAAAVGGALCSFAIISRRHRLLVEELSDASICGAADLGDLPQQEWAQAWRFWDHLIARWEPDEDRRALWVSFSIGGLWLLLAELDVRVQPAWVFQLAERLARRLDGVRQLSVVGSEEEFSKFVGVTSPRKQPFVEAAIRLLARGGSSDLTLRKIAAEAGVSLGTTARIFEGRADILFSVREELARRAFSRRALVDGPLGTSIGRTFFNGAGEPLVENSAARAWHCIACREGNTEDFTVGPLWYRAKSSIDWLRMHGVTNPDLTDGWVWLTLILSAFSEALHSPHDQRRSVVDQRVTAISNLVFSDAPHAAK